MKVRLKPAHVDLRSMFIEFQFHEGPIKTEAHKQLHHTALRFNSMKVRLKHWSINRERANKVVSIP